MIIRSRTFKQWMDANLKDYYKDIAGHGCSAGFPGLTYYTDTMKLYGKFKDEIFEMLADDAEDQGVTIPELIASFNGAKDVWDSGTFENLLVWYAAERIAYNATEENEDEDD